MVSYSRYSKDRKSPYQLQRRKTKLVANALARRGIAGNCLLVEWHTPPEGMWHPTHDELQLAGVLN